MILMGKTDIKRAAIYVFHEKDGVVDDYVPVFLAELKKFVCHLAVVINGTVNEAGKGKLDPVCDDLFIRPNEGYDITGYREGLERIGWDQLKGYDECILVNSTLYGPIYPFDEMFDTMAARDVDFWGITKHHKVDFDCFGTCKYGYIPEHIQSSFLVVRQPMLSDGYYQGVWEQLPKIHSYEEAIGFFEVVFTKESVEKGYRAGLYVNTDDLEGYTRYPLMMMSSELIKNRKCPVMKQKAFSQNYFDILTDTIGSATVDSFEFIREHTSYDVNLIWDNILRTCNMVDIKNMLHLNYILPQDYRIPGETAKEKKIALMMHLYYPDLVDYCLNYARSMPGYADLIITTPREDTKKLVEERVKDMNFHHVRVLLIDNRGRDVSSLLVGCRPYVDEYDYICFVHDKKTTQMKPFANGDSFAYQCFENNLASEEFVENVISTFERNPRLGMLFPPVPSHGNFYQMIGTEWASNYQNTLSLAYKLNLRCHIYWEKEPIAPLGTMFWFRPQALKTLFGHGWKYDDFAPEPNGFDGTLLHAIERIYGYVAQHEGYYPAWLMSDHFARIEVTNLYFTVRELNKQLFKKYFTTNLLDMTQRMETNLAFVWTKDLGIKRWVKKYCPRPLWAPFKKIYHFLKPQ